MLRRTALSLLGLFLLVPVSSATWSIVCVNTRTREVGVASATCLVNFNLRTGVPVIYVGEGAAAAQSFLDSTGNNRQLIFNSFRDTEETPAEILAQLAQYDLGHQSRQYGIVNFAGAPVTFTGRQDGLAATGVTGQVGDFLYAIQGNVLAGDEIVFAAEAAFRETKGDMGQKIMAAMHAARDLGGDGRCSCDEGSPTSCGVPPPGFVKSAHVGVLLVARIGDTNDGCGRRGCARGDYYLAQNVIAGVAAPDPVFTLQERYDFWRKDHQGRPDGVLSTVHGAKPLVAGEVRTIVVRLRDIDDLPLDHGGAQLVVSTVDGAPSLAEVGPVQDRGDGSYSFTLTPGKTPGHDRFVITVTDVNPEDPEDVLTATLFPYLDIDTLPATLSSAPSAVDAALGGNVAFVLERADDAFAPYLMVARLVPASAPGAFPVIAIPRAPFFPGGPGRLDGLGHAETELAIPAGALLALVGRRIEFNALVLDGGFAPTNHVTLDVR